MSLPHAILTALLEKPSSGLELTRRFDRSIGYFWSATHQQIYRELGKLEESELIRAQPAAQPARGT
ncbi:PadR family transcriptional regulator, partial [Kitasatospora sp. NPDC059088]|uniref:PadR family transcriptional regulator n=1 Tax=Kitasatospora sp. NPDC059088 TaxID=3346722 RepID=UPI0036D1E49A